MIEKRIYVSMSSYLAGRLLGIQRGQAELQHMLEQLGRPDVKPREVDDCWVPALRSITHLRRIADIQLRLDCGATVIGKSRSRHFTAAFDSGCSAWLTIDDDVEASIETLAWLITAIEWDNLEAEPRVCMAPCLLREQGIVNVEWSPIIAKRAIHHPRYPHGQARAAKRGGFGLVAMNRAALGAIADACGRHWRDDDGQDKFPVFRDSLDGAGRWSGEDVAFFERLPARVQVEALSIGETLHAGYGLDFGDLDT